MIAFNWKLIEPKPAFGPPFWSLQTLSDDSLPTADGGSSAVKGMALISECEWSGVLLVDYGFTNFYGHQGPAGVLVGFEDIAAAKHWIERIVASFAFARLPLEP